MPNNTSSPEDEAKRLVEFGVYLADFSKLTFEKTGVSLIYQDKAAEVITSLYYRYANEIIRPAINSGVIQNFKIAANSELVIMLASPIVETDDKTRSKYTAQLAMYCAQRIVIQWNSLNEAKCMTLLAEDKELQSFLAEHLTWLYLLEPAYYYPVFSNSQTWRLYYYLLRDRTKIL